MFDVEVKNLADPDKKDAIICDLDGTLCLLNGRNPYDATECYYDKLNHPVYRLLKKYQKDGYAIVIVTGRSKTHAENTMKWLKEHNILPDILIMREPKDKQPDFSLKHSAYNQYIKPKYNVEFVLEDRDQMVEMYRYDLGLTVFQVNRGNF